MTTAAIYARYSSENQREASIEDQVEVCRRLAGRQGWRIVEVYGDAAQSGASRFRREYLRLVADAESRRFDVIVVESLDRLGRKLADVADLHDCMQFAGVRIHTVIAGEITPMHIGMLGTAAQMYLSDLKEKTWRRAARPRPSGTHPGRAGLWLRRRERRAREGHQRAAYGASTRPKRRSWCVSLPTLPTAAARARLPEP